MRRWEGTSYCTWTSFWPGISELLEKRNNLSEVTQQDGCQAQNSSCITTAVLSSKHHSNIGWPKWFNHTTFSPPPLRGAKSAHTPQVQISWAGSRPFHCTSTLLWKIEIRSLGSVDSEQVIQLAVPTPASTIIKDATSWMAQRDGFYSTYFAHSKKGWWFSSNSGSATPRSVYKVSSLSEVIAHSWCSSICDERRLVWDCRLERRLHACSHCSPLQEVPKILFSGSGL